jgi:hypothetical protein
MSRLTSLSPQAIRAMYSSETDQDLIALLTIYDPNTPTTVLFRFADTYTTRLADQTTDQEIVYGVTSNSNEYSFLPFQVTLPTEQDTGMGQCSIIISYALPEAIAVIRDGLFNKPAKVLIQYVLSGTPDVVEVSFIDFYITSVNYSAQQITLNLDMISLSREPFPCFNFTPGYFPGLF